VAGRERRPFPLLPVGNRPLLDALFRALAEAGQPAAELFLHGDPRRVRRYVEDGHAWGLTLRCHSVREPAALLAEPLRAAPVLNGPGVVASLAVAPEQLARWLAAGANAPLLDADGQLVAARFDAEAERWAFIVDAGPRLTLNRTLHWLRGSPSA
jgi:hypothetical protein